MVAAPFLMVQKSKTIYGINVVLLMIKHTGRGEVIVIEKKLILNYTLVSLLWVSPLSR
jgi:hypothetical protein